MLELKKISKTYKSKKGSSCNALKNINIKFPDKGLVFILGKSGSGKSTLLNIIGGLDAPDAGEIVIKGKSSKDFSQKDYDAYRNTFLGFIFQEYNVMDDFSVYDNVALSLKLQNQKVDKEVVEDILDKVGLKGFEKRKPNELSGGQKQRVAIARALVKQTEIILGDEPTGNLDSNTSKQIFKILGKLAQNKLVIIVSHDRDSAEKYADRIIELADGEVIADVSKRHEGVEDFLITNKTITIPSDRPLNAQEIRKVNKALNEKPLKIRQRSDSRFEKTGTVESQKNDGCRLIRSKFPNKYATQLGVSNFKTKKFRLVVTIFLTVISLALFGLSQIFAGYDIAVASSKSFEENNISEIVLKQGTYIEEFDSFNMSSMETIDKQTYDKLTQDYVTNHLDFYSLEMTYKNPEFDIMNMIMSMVGRNLSTPYTTTSQGVVIAELSDIKKYFGGDACEIIKGSYPLDTDVKVVITDYLADSLIAINKNQYLQEIAAMGDEYNYLKDDLYEYILLVGINDIMGLKVDVSGIISTDYKTKYKDLIDTYNASSDQFTSHADYDKYCLEVKNYYSILFAKSETFINSVNTTVGYAKVSTIKFRPTFGEYKKGLPSTKYAYKLDELIKQLNVSGYDMQYLYDNKILSDGADSYINDSNIKNPVIIPLTTYKEILEQYVLKMEEELEKNEDSSKRQSLTEAQALLNNLIVGNYIFDANAIKDYQKINMGTFNLLDIADGPVYEEYLNVVGVIDFNLLTQKIPATASYGSIVCAIFSDENIVKSAAANNSLRAIYVTLPNSERLVREYLKIANDNFIYHESEISATLYLVSNIFKIFSIVFQWVALIMGIFSTILLFNFITISVVNKQKEIGILRAIGAKGSDVGKIFLIESTIMGAITVICSWGLIFLGTHLINSLLVNSFKSYLQSTIINRITLLTVGFTPIFAVLVACALVVLFATIIPVIKISRMKPVDAIKKL